MAKSVVPVNGEVFRWAVEESGLSMGEVATDLLDEIVASPLIPPADLPQPTKAERKPPRV